MPIVVILFVSSVFAVLMGIDGMRFVFRGTRDYLVGSLGCSSYAARLAATVGALAVLCTGVAALMTLFAWAGGVRPFSRRM